ncbi:MAG TPA: glycosyltransferase family 4 protein [Candidatus Nanopelagicales bacterium]|nr:glycosyltransferase family 4 protein [Candidatus Nanopelagicales bacterium]
MSMRVGLVCPYAWDVPGGVRSHVSDLATTLRVRGHEVNVLAPVEEDQEIPDWVTDGGRPVAVPYNGSVARLSFGVKATRRVRAWIREGDFDIVHIHEPLAPSLSLLTCWSARGPLVATWHSSHDRSRVLTAGYYVAQTAMEKLRGSIAVSEEARRTLIGHVGGDAVLIPNGVRVKDFTPDSHDRQRRRELLFLGRIKEPRKGLSVLIEALPMILDQVPDLTVIVAGPGDDEDFRKEIPDKIDQAITFVGTVSDQRKQELLREVQVYVAPHTGGESFGIVLVEAMAAGACVVASDIPAFQQVLEHGKAGRLFTTNDPRSLADAVLSVLADDAARRALVDRGYARAEQYDWDTVVDEVLDVYDSVRVPGDKVTEDLRGQALGRFAARTNFIRGRRGDKDDREQS